MTESKKAPKRNKQLYQQHPESWVIQTTVWTPRVDGVRRKVYVRGVVSDEVGTLLLSLISDEEALPKGLEEKVDAVLDEMRGNR